MVHFARPELVIPPPDLFWIASMTNSRYLPLNYVYMLQGWSAGWDVARLASRAGRACGGWTVGDFSGGTAMGLKLQPEAVYTHESCSPATAAITCEIFRVDFTSCDPVTSVPHCEPWRP
nr:hypothetical protein CFP56_60700 [Quercus suber]